MKLKGFFLSLAFLILMTVNSYAGNAVVVTKTLKTSTGSTITDLSLTNGVAVYSETIYVTDDLGIRAILVTEDKAGGTGDVDISAEYSIDGTNFYPGYTTSSGALTIDSNIVTALGNATRYIVFTARPAPFMRLKFDPDADSEISASFIYLRDRQED